MEDKDLLVFNQAEMLTIFHPCGMKKSIISQRGSINYCFKSGLLTKEGKNVLNKNSFTLYSCNYKPL